jgi:predicted nucleic acid-binding protein
LRAIVDTNVIAYYLLETTGFSDLVRRFWRSNAEVAAPAHWEAELANLIWLSARHELITVDMVPAKLQLATQLGIHSVPVRNLWQGGVLRSISSGLAVYDALFVELADRERLPLITFDQQIRRAFPDIARTP